MGDDHLTDRKISKLQRMLAGPRAPAPPQRPAEEPSRGSLGKYKLLRMLAPQTWEVSDGKHPAALVLRVLGSSQDPNLVASVCAELRPLAALQHPVIVTYKKLSQVGGGYFTIREFVAGEPIDRQAPLPVPSLQIVYEVARAIEYAHERGQAHGALSPSNVILSPTGHPFVVDFSARYLRGRFQPPAPTAPSPEADLLALQALYISLMAAAPFEDVAAGARPPLRPMHPAADRRLAELTEVEVGSASAFADALAQVLQALPSDYTSNLGVLERYQRRTQTA